MCNHVLLELGLNPFDETEVNLLTELNITLKKFYNTCRSWGYFPIFIFKNCKSSNSFKLQVFGMSKITLIINKVWNTLIFLWDVFYELFLYFIKNIKSKYKICVSF